MTILVFSAFIKPFGKNSQYRTYPVYSDFSVKVTIKPVFTTITKSSTLAT